MEDSMLINQFNIINNILHHLEYIQNKSNFDL